MNKFLKIFETSIFGLLLLLLIFIPLYPKFPLLNIKGTFVAVRAEDLFIALALSLWFCYILISGKFRKFISDRLVQALFLFFFIGGLSLFSGVFLTHTVSLNLGFFHYMRRVELMMLMPLAYFAIKSRKEIHISLVILAVVVFLVNLYALGQQYLSWPVISTTNSEFSKGLLLYLTPGARVNSTFAGHYDLAVFLVMALVIISSLFFYLKNIFWKISVSLLGLISFVVLVMTAARLSFLAVLVGGFISLLLSGKKIFIVLMIILAGVVLVYPSQLRDRFISTITINILQEGARYAPQDEEQSVRSKLNIPTLKVKVTSQSAQEQEEAENNNATASSKVASDITPGEPVDTTQLGVDRSFKIRLNLEWPRAIRAFLKNPLLGTGYSSLGLATDNDILRSLGEIGILGTFAFALILLEIIKRIWKMYRSGDKFMKYFSAGILSLIIAFIVNSLFIDVFEASKIASLFWLVIGINLAMEKFK